MARFGKNSINFFQSGFASTRTISVRWQSNNAPEDWPRIGNSSTKLPSTSRPGTTRTHTADSSENHELPCRKRCFSLLLFHAAGGHRRHQRPFDASRHVTMTVKPAGHAVAGTQTPRALWTENQTSSALALNTKQLSQSKAVRKVTTVGAESQQRTSKPSNRCVCVCGGFASPWHGTEDTKLLRDQVLSREN